MRICREIEPRTSAIRRAVSNIRVHYVVFPGTADPERGPPDLTRWHEKVSQLWQEIGGKEGGLFEWENLVPPWPTPTPSPTPTPIPTTSPEYAPESSATPTVDTGQADSPTPPAPR